MLDAHAYAMQVKLCKANTRGVTDTMVILLFRFKITHSNIAYANHCIPILRVASRNGSRLIRYEPQQAEVRRPARKGLEAASCQTEPGRNNRDEPQRPCPTPFRSGLGHLDLFSFDSNPEPNPQNLRRGEANGPPEPTERLGHLSRGGLRSSGIPHEGSTNPISE